MKQTNTVLKLSLILVVLISVCITGLYWLYSSQQNSNAGGYIGNRNRTITNAEDTRLSNSDLVFTFKNDWDKKNVNVTSEVTWLETLDNKLFAGTSNWTAGNNSIIKKESPVLLRKDCSNCEWEIDQSFAGAASIKAMANLRIERDNEGKAIPAQEFLFIAPDQPDSVSAFIRSSSGETVRSDLPKTAANQGDKGYNYIRSALTHVDPVSQKQYIYAGTAEGQVYRGILDPSTLKIAWDNEPELNYSKRVHSMTVMDDKVYASIGIGDDPEDGGLYVRENGDAPSWKLVYRWELEKGDDKPGLRGITPFVDHAGGEEYLLGGVESTGEIKKIIPGDTYSEQTVLDLRDYFKAEFGEPLAGSATIAAYNRFEPFVNPITGKKNDIVTLWINHPDRKNNVTSKSAYFLIRDDKGNYTYHNIYDKNHTPNVPIGLQSVRTALASPFKGEENVIYFGGFDGGGPGSTKDKLQSGWIYKGTITNK